MKEMASMNRPLMLRSSSTPLTSSSEILAQHVQEFSSFTSYTFTRNVKKVSSYDIVVIKNNSF